MPTYGFICSNCEHRFDELLSVNDREKPLTASCSKCGEKEIKREYDSFSQTIGSDTTLTANKATGGRWNELMGRMKKGVAKRYHKNLDIASANSGRYWRG